MPAFPIVPVDRHFLLQRKEPRDCGSKSMWGSDRAVCTRATPLPAHGRTPAFRRCSVGTFEVSHFVGLEADPERNEHDIRPIGFYDASVFRWKSRKFLIHQHTSIVSQPVSSMSAATHLTRLWPGPAAVCRGAPRVVAAGRGVSGRAESWQRMTHLRLPRLVCDTRLRYQRVCTSKRSLCSVGKGNVAL